MYEKVKKIIAKELNIASDKISQDSKLSEDLGADSLDAVELVMALEEEFDITVEDSAALGFVTVADIVKYVEETK